MLAGSNKKIKRSIFLPLQLSIKFLTPISLIAWAILGYFFVIGSPTSPASIMTSVALFKI